MHTPNNTNITHTLHTHGMLTTQTHMPLNTYMHITPHMLTQHNHASSHTNFTHITCTSHTAHTHVHHMYTVYTHTCTSHVYCIHTHTYVHHMYTVYTHTHHTHSYQILAWSPVTFVGDFLQLLPAFISETTIFEVFHSLLDLPCLTATLQAHYILSLHSHTVEPGLYPQYASCLAAFQDTTHRLMFGHFLRSENGKGDTIDHLGRIHNILMDFVNHERVKGLARVAPLLLK